MRERRHIDAKEQDNFSVRDMKEVANMLTGTTKVLTTLLSAVAAVSLLVGGIGIMNIMLVSVTERTREIGIRLAIGALEREVLMQFLVEAVALSSLGGALGIVLAIGASIGLADVLEVPYVFNGGIVVTAFAFSAAVGVIFGYFPARRAARLGPHRGPSQGVTGSSFRPGCRNPGHGRSCRSPSLPAAARSPHDLDGPRRSG